MGSSASAQIVHDLGEEIDAGNISLASARADGTLSSASVQASLTNQTAEVRRVSIHLGQAFYLVNNGRGKDLVATEVYFSDGDYQSDGRRPFIELEPGIETAVMFVAYYVDFDKDIPSSEERFSIGDMPADLESVVASVSTFAFANPSMDIAVTAQMAIWLAQGESLDDIRSKIEFTDAQEGLAQYFNL